MWIVIGYLLVRFLLGIFVVLFVLGLLLFWFVGKCVALLARIFVAVMDAWVDHHRPEPQAKYSSRR